MQKTTNPHAKVRVYPQAAGIQALTVLIALFAAMSLTAAIHSTAFANPCDEFDATTGTVEGATVDIGTTLHFKVLADPADDAPGSVQVGNGSSAALDTAYSGAVTIPERVEHDGTAYEVTWCAANSFRLSRISRVVLPSTLTRIRSYAFYCCYNLTSVDFQGTPQLSYIEGHAFETPNANGALSQMRFPASLHSVGVYAFAGQSALVDLSFEGESLEFLGQYAFTNCKGLKSAHVPALTAASSSFGGYCFAGCSNLEFVEFLGNVASFPDELIGTRYFDNCEKLATVVYRGKKIIPSWKNYGSATDVYYEFRSSNPILYFTITYYASQQDAEAGADALGSVCVRSDTPLSSIEPGMPTSDEKGAIVYDGAPIAPPEGFDSWGYEGNPVATSSPTDSLYAYPVNSHDLATASMTLETDTFAYTGNAVMPQPIVCTTLGEQLAAGSDYTLAYERLDDAGNWIANANCVDIGTMRVIATGTGAYQGQLTATYEIAHAQEGDTFTSGGVTYLITTATDGSAPGVASVGDGAQPAIATDTEGTLTIPPTVKPDGSTIEYRVTALSNRAFGSSSAQGACTKLTQVNLPEGIVSLGTYAFGFCTKLASATIPASTTDIGARAFQNCTKLASLSFQGTTTRKFGAFCFAFCSSLPSVTLPSASVFRENAFANCTKLARVDFLGTVAQSGTTQFQGCTRLTRVVYHTTKTWAGSFPSNPTVYGVATFNDAKGKRIGQAILKKGTPVDKILPGITSTYKLSGSVPAAPSGYGCWRIAKSSATSFKGTCTLEPAGVANGKKKVGGSGTSKASYRVISNKTRTVAYAACKSTNKTKATIPATVKLNNCTYTVTRVDAKAFKGTKAKTITVKSKKITTFSRAFTSSVVAKVIASKSKKAAYKKLLTKKKCGRTVTLSWK